MILQKRGEINVGEALISSGIKVFLFKTKKNLVSGVDIAVIRTNSTCEL